MVSFESYRRNFDGTDVELDFSLSHSTWYGFSICIDQLKIYSSGTRRPPQPLNGRTVFLDISQPSSSTGNDGRDDEESLANHMHPLIFLLVLSLLCTLIFNYPSSN